MLKALKILKTQVLDVLNGLPKEPPKQHASTCYTSLLQLLHRFGSL